MSTPTLIHIELSRTERELLCGFLGLGINEIVKRVGRGEKHHEAQLRAARRVLQKLREAK